MSLRGCADATPSVSQKSSCSATPVRQLVRPANGSASAAAEEGYPVACRAPRDSVSCRCGSHRARRWHWRQQVAGRVRRQQPALVAVASHAASQGVFEIVPEHRQPMKVPAPAPLPFSHARHYERGWKMKSGGYRRARWLLVVRDARSHSALAAGVRLAALPSGRRQRHCCAKARAKNAGL